MSHLACLTCAGAPLVTYFETQCLDLPAYGGSALPESLWLSDVLEQVC
jgi:hypothetical protein